MIVDAVFCRPVEWDKEEKGRGLRTISYAWDMFSLEAMSLRMFPMFCYSLIHRWGSKRHKGA